MTLTPQQMLDQAVAARHNLLIGRLAYIVEADGRRVQYTKTDLDKLEAEIAALTAQVNNTPILTGAIGFLL